MVRHLFVLLPGSASLEWYRQLEGELHGAHVEEGHGASWNEWELP